MTTPRWTRDDPAVQDALRQLEAELNHPAMAAAVLGNPEDRPSCAACGDWDRTVADVPITRTTDAKLCAGCAGNGEVLRVLAEEVES